MLGQTWDHNNDILVAIRSTNSTHTKNLAQRLVLSLVSKVYDPIVLVAPFTFGARLILKDIWHVHGRSWDDELPKKTQLTDSLHEVSNCGSRRRSLYQEFTFQYRSNILNSTCSVTARKTYSVQYDLLGLK